MTAADWLALAALVVAVASLGLNRRGVNSSARSARAAERSADAAARSAEEARRTRLDQSGPAVVITSQKPLRMRWMTGKYRPPGYDPPGEAMPETYFDMPGDANVWLLLGVHLMFRNEGTRTCRVRVIAAARIDRADDPDDTALETLLRPAAEKPDTRVADGVIRLAPGETGGLVVRVGTTIGVWVEQGDQPYRFGVAAEVDKEGARQQWVVTVATELLSAIQHNASQYRVLPHVLPELLVEEMPRAYPDPAAVPTPPPVDGRRRPWWKVGPVTRRR